MEKRLSHMSVLSERVRKIEFSRKKAMYMLIKASKGQFISRYIVWKIIIAVYSIILSLKFKIMNHANAMSTILVAMWMNESMVKLGSMLDVLSWNYHFCLQYTHVLAQAHKKVLTNYFQSPKFQKIESKAFDLCAMQSNKER